MTTNGDIDLAEMIFALPDGEIVLVTLDKNREYWIESNEGKNRLYSYAVLYTDMIYLGGF